MRKTKKNDKKNKIFYTIKFIIIGDSSVGKTNIVHRFGKNEFSNEYANTVGMDYLSCNVEIDEKIFHLQLWDTAGSEKFRSVTRGYYSNTACVLVVYDITSEKSFISVKAWIEDCKAYTSKNAHFVLVGNKNDLEAQRKVNKDEAWAFATENGMSFFESSALTAYNINEIFIDSCKIINDKINNKEYDFEDPSNGIKIKEVHEDMKITKTINSSNNKKLDKDLHIEKPNDSQHRSKCC